MHDIPSKTKKKKFIFNPVSFFGSQSFFAVFKSIQLEFLSHTFKYSLACIFLILLLIRESWKCEMGSCASQ